MKNQKAKRGQSAQRKPLPSGKRRRFPTSALAECGYWSATVQKVVRRWRDTIGEECCKDYLVTCVRSAAPGNDIHVECRSGHKGYVLDLLVALHKLLADPKNPDRWLLEFCSAGNEYVRGKPTPYTYERIQELIRKMGGPKIEINTLAEHAFRLRLTVL